MVRGKMIVVVSAMLFLVASVAQGYTPGVPTGLTGAPGEGTCANCHDNLNTGSGSVVVSAPTDYSAGETIEVFVQVSHNGQKKWGFEITALDDSDQPVGEFTITDAARTQLDVDGDNGRQYVMHTEAGTDEDVLDENPGWTFDWTAPAGRPDVTFYVCAVAANNGQGTNGDFCYTASLSSTVTAIEDASSWGRIKRLYQ